MRPLLTAIFAKRETYLTRLLGAILVRHWGVLIAVPALGNVHPDEAIGYYREMLAVFERHASRLAEDRPELVSKGRETLEREFTEATY